MKERWPVGENFPKAKTTNDLNEIGQERYKSLRSAKSQPPAILERIKKINEFIGPFGGEALYAREELLEDTFVCWILSDENPDKVQWLDPKDLI